MAVGKVTLSLSQCLDGSNYLYNGQQGSRDMLESYLCDDECMMVWHLPVVPSQPLQVGRSLDHFCFDCLLFSAKNQCFLFFL